MSLKFAATFSHDGRGDFPLVVGFFTPDRQGHALRLRQSLLSFNLSHRLCCVESVHSSISTRGDPESFVTKPAFIRFWIDKHNSPVLYVDCDVVFCAFPDLLREAMHQAIDLAVFNWLSGEENTTYFPHAGFTSAEQGRGALVEGFSIPFHSDTQLIVSGAVQYWGASATASKLLSFWAKVIGENSRCRDDHCLDFAHNNFDYRARPQTLWLPRSYCRYAWWPGIAAVIDHPDVPAVNQPWQELKHGSGGLRYHPTELVEKKAPIMLRRMLI